MQRKWMAAAATLGLAGGVAGTAGAHEGPQAKGAADDLVGPITKLLAPKVLPTRGGPETNGVFQPPFVEPRIGELETTAKCLDGASDAGLKRCKPAAGTLVQLPDGKVLYWNNLGGTENVKFSIVGEYGAVAEDDEARRLTLAPDGKPSWDVPTPKDGGANPKGEREPTDPLIPGLETNEPHNDGALFGSHQLFLPDGKLLVQGGTDYSLDPGVDGLPLGVVELSGLRSTRVYDPATNRFTQTGDTEQQRWYPTMLSLGNGEVLNFGGVRKLLKPVYRDKPLDSLQNVKQTERFDPAKGTWSDEGAGAQRDLPLYPRVHLLPNGKVFYNASGQAFNPFGQSLGEAFWGIQAIYDPERRRWTDKGYAGPDPVNGGFRGSQSSTMLPLEPGRDGRYAKAQFLSSGGVLLPTPGSYLAVAESRLTTVDTAGGRERITTERTGPLHQPRWYGSQVLLPTGEVITFSGADKDEVLGPGTEFPVQQAELYDPKTKRWAPIATASRPRTYHNTAVLRPSGEVLVGGHATISTAYLNNTTLPGGFAPHDGRDPSFEVFQPPYLFRGARPKVKKVRASIRPGQTFGIRLAKGTRAKDVDSVRLTRNTAITHLVDADQRQVVLQVVRRKGTLLEVKAPPTGDVAPAGPYHLFVNRDRGKGPVPSVGRQVTVLRDR